MRKTEMPGRASLAAPDPAAIVEREAGLHQNLSSRQVAMIGLGSTIGTGLFLGSAISVKLAGPAVILSFLGGSMIALTVMWALAEMTAEHPAAGSFGLHAEIYLHPWAGFAIRYTYWLCLVVIVGSEVVAAAIYCKLWFPGIPSWMWGGGLFRRDNLLEHRQHPELRAIRVLVSHDQGIDHRGFPGAGNGASAGHRIPTHRGRQLQRFLFQGLDRCAARNHHSGLQFSGHRGGGRHGWRSGRTASRRAAGASPHSVLPGAVLSRGPDAGGRNRAMESNRSWRESLRPRFPDRGHSRRGACDEFCCADGGAFKRHVQYLFHIKIALLSGSRRLCAGGTRPLEQTWHAGIRGAGLQRRNGRGGSVVPFPRGHGLRLHDRRGVLRRAVHLEHDSNHPSGVPAGQRWRGKTGIAL